MIILGGIDVILAQIKRRIFKIDGSADQMSSSKTTVPKWITTPPYDPANGEVLLGVDGPERIQIAADGKIYPPLCSGGYPPTKTAYESSAGPPAVTELGADQNVGVANQWSEGCIVVPAAATVKIGATSLPAPGVTIVIPVKWYDVVNMGSGVSSSWLIRTRVQSTTATVVSR